MKEEDKKIQQDGHIPHGIRYENEFRVTIDRDGKQCYERDYNNINTRNQISPNNKDRQ